VLVQAGFWQTVADALFWLQLCWVLSGFVLMAYLAFKVFPGPKVLTHPDPNRFAVGGDRVNEKPIEHANDKLSRKGNVTRSSWQGL
jgi:hypothetical protein